MADFILFAVLILILGPAVFYLRRAGKQGIRCIGCPSGKACHGTCAGCSGSCHGGEASKDNESRN